MIATLNDFTSYDFTTRDLEGPLVSVSAPPARL